MSLTSTRPVPARIRRALAALAVAALLGSIVAVAAPQEAKVALAIGGGVATPMVAVGGDHACALLADGTVRCWGRNNSGQLGDGTSTNRLRPTTVTYSDGTRLSGVTALAAGDLFTCALLADTTVRCWGYNWYYDLGDGTNITRSHPVAVSNTDGTGILTGVTSITGGLYHTCASMADGTARCWGANWNGQLGDGTTTDRSRPIVVSNSDGTGSLTGVVSVAAGGDHACALLADTTVRCWGRGGSGQLGDGNTSQRNRPVAVSNSDGTGLLTGAIELRAGSAWSCARLADTTLRCWGFNSVGNLGDGTTSNRSRPVAVSNSDGTGPFTGATALSQLPSCALVTGGTAVCWGWNNMGQVGDGTTTNRPRPVAVASTDGTSVLTGVTSIASSTGSNQSACAVVGGTQIRCWGIGSYGRLGNGSSVAAANPLPVIVEPFPYRLTVSVTGAGSVTSGDGAISACSATSGTCVEDTTATVVLTATPGNAGDPISWTGCASTTTDTCTVALTADRAVSVRFGTAGGDGGDDDGGSDVTPTPTPTPAPVATASVRKVRFAIAGGGRLVANRVPLTVTWAGPTDGTAASYELQTRTGSGAWSASKSVTGTTAAVTARVGQRFEVRVRAIDGSAATSDWAASATTPRLVQETAGVYSGAWKGWRETRMSGGRSRWTWIERRTATFTVTGRAVGLVTATGPVSGRIAIYVDGKLAGRRNLQTATETYGLIGLVRRWASSGTHTVKVEVLPAPNGQRADVDALIVLD